MIHQINPFLQSAVRKGHRLISESQQNVMLAQGISSACGDMVGLISSGNLDGAIGTAHNVRNMALQIGQNTQEINQMISERLDMASHILGRIDYRVHELTGALQTLRGGPSIGQPMITSASPYTMYSPEIFQ